MSESPDLFTFLFQTPATQEKFGGDRIPRLLLGILSVQVRDCVTMDHIPEGGMQE